MFNFILKSAKYYAGANLALALAVAITTAIIGGALIVGDSITFSLEQSTHYRLGNITHSITAGERVFTDELAKRISQQSGVESCSVLKTEGSGSAGGGELSLSKIQVLGIDSLFRHVAGENFPATAMQEGEALISENLAARLMLKVGDSFLLRMKHIGVIPANTPFVSAENQITSARVRVKTILGRDSLGRFGLRNSQTAPFNIFVAKDWLSKRMKLQGKANLILSRTIGDEGLEKNALRAWTLSDANINVEKVEATNEWQLTSERVFIEDRFAESVFKVFPEAKGVFTYFVNKITHEKYSTPYSFVSSLPDTELQTNEIVLNQWAADDLNAEEGDSIGLNFFRVGSLRQLSEDSLQFLVKKIVPIDGSFADKNLTLNLPGLSDVGNCRDWETGVPIDLDAIRTKDEAYWDHHRGTPKAFIQLSQARRLWKNRFGSLSAIRVPVSTTDSSALIAKVQAELEPLRSGLKVNAVKESGLTAARGGVDFGELFIGLSFFILASGIILTVLLFMFQLKQREKQLATLSALGFSQKKIVSLVLSEQLLVSIIGSAFGILLSVFYTVLVFDALNQLWYDIVRTQVLEIKIQSSTMLFAYFISVFVSLISISFTVRKTLRRQIAEISKHKKITSRKQFLQKAALMLSFFGTIGIMVWQFSLAKAQDPAMFFLAGGFLLVFTLVFFSFLLSRMPNGRSHVFGLSSLVIKNLSRNRSRSFLVVLLLTIGTFLVVSTGANKKDMFVDAEKKSSGTGGFLLYAESTAPILQNLNNAQVREEFVLQKSKNILQCKLWPGDDASCLNLNLIANPRILGVNPEQLSGRFSFATRTDDLNTENPWESLNDTSSCVVPAIADQTVITWGLGKAVGDTLVYQDSRGEKMYVKLVGGLAASVFQGSVLISDLHFAKHFPYSSGSNVFLVGGEAQDATDIGKELELAFKQHGFSTEQTAARLAEFKTIENTYLSIFLVLGAIGLLLGTVGIAIVLAKSILERKNEIALLRALGFSLQKVFLIFSFEYALLLFVGIFFGTFTALLAVWPNLFSEQVDNSPAFILWLMLLVALNGLFWIAVINWFALQKQNKRLTLEAQL